MDEKVNLLLLWQLLRANVICNNVDCGKCYAETGCDSCPKTDGNHLRNAKIVADRLYEICYFFGSTNEAPVSVEEVLNLLQSTTGEQDDTHN